MHQNHPNCCNYNIFAVQMVFHFLTSASERVTCSILPEVPGISRMIEISSLSGEGVEESIVWLEWDEMGCTVNMCTCCSVA